MNEDYLWDRSGEPDPEIKELEEILGTLRYQPRELEIPADLEVGGKRNLFRSFRLPVAVAAAIALVLSGAALWFGLQRMQHSSQPQRATAPTAPEITATPKPSRESLAVNPDYKEIPDATVKRSSSTHASTANKNKVHREPGKSAVDNPQFAANRQEALAARDQLFLALRVASTKLNFAQKKTQSPNNKDMIQNQHRIG